MKVLTEGHKYVLDHFENNSEGTTIQFIEKEMNEAGELVTINDGTTNEEVLKMLIDRMNVLNKKFSCRDNSLAITHMEDALLRLEKRTADRKKRGVEGKAKA